ncbi:MAG: iron chelate uptake ABC transporter family permease subunit [Egibacteraceae bacterium]
MAFVPHVARLNVGADHRRVLPVSALLGAVFLQLVDLAARMLGQPAELPLSIVTAVCGVPFFLWLPRRRSPNPTRSGWRGERRRFWGAASYTLLVWGTPRSLSTRGCRGASPA